MRSSMNVTCILDALNQYLQPSRRFSYFDQYLIPFPLHWYIVKA